MKKGTAGSTTRGLSVVLVLALLVLVSGYASAQQRSVTSFFVQEAKLTASDGADDDSFGGSVSISGDTLVVGASWDDDSGHASGSAYVFERDGDGPGAWAQVAKLTASDAAELDEFGSSVSIGGDTVVVGAPGDDGSSYDFGSAYIFERDEGGLGNWGEAAKLTASDGAEFAKFGTSVSISGDTLIVGAPGDDSGSAYVFERDAGGSGNWGEVAKLTASDGASGESFGWSVSISGDTVVIGAYHDYPDGSAYLFEEPETGWPESMTETAKLTASDGVEYGAFGYSVAISGDAVIVGAPADDSNGENSGSAYLFEKPESGWPATMTETTKLTASDGATYNNLGHSVSISGDTAVAGTPQGTNSSGAYSGSAYLFTKPESGWPATMTETTKLTASDGDWTDFFGWSVSISGDTVVSGAYHDDDLGEDSGSAYVFGPFEPVAWVYLPVVLRGGP